MAKVSPAGGHSQQAGIQPQHRQQACSGSLTSSRASSPALSRKHYGALTALYTARVSLVFTRNRASSFGMLSSYKGEGGRGWGCRNVGAIILEAHEHMGT
eukprot:1157275-Pelagomonas_calceolata.AAC.2